MHTSVRVVSVVLAFTLAIGTSFGSFSQRSAAAVGGPVIIGGDDLTDHGGVTSSGVLLDGWLYIRRALENIAPNVTRANDGSVAAIGSSPSTSTSSDAGAAIGRAATQAGLTVTYHDGATGITAFFAALAAGTARPKIIWISGTGAGNDLGSTGEITALNANALRIADFVNAGGGLMSHGSEYGWLFALLPGLSSVDSGSSDDLELTAAGIAAFPGVTNSNINAGPWHNHFEGNFGGLGILAVSNDVRDSKTRERAAVIIGGAAVTLPGRITLTPGTATNPVGTNHTVTATVLNEQAQPASGITVTFAVTAGPNIGRTGTAVTNASGQATFTYTGSGGPGTDTIEASYFDERAATRRSDTATKTWTGTPSSGPRSGASVTLSSPSCDFMQVRAIGLTPGLPHQIVVTRSPGGSTHVINVTPDASGTAGDTIELQREFGTTGGSFSAFVRLTGNQVTVSNTVTLVTAACPAPAPAPVQTPTPTAAPTPTPAPTPVAIGRLPSTTTGGELAGTALVLLVLIALGAIVGRKHLVRG